MSYRMMTSNERIEMFREILRPPNLLPFKIKEGGNNHRHIVIDRETAQAIMETYDALNATNRANMLAMPLERMLSTVRKMKNLHVGLTQVKKKIERRKN